MSIEIAKGLSDTERDHQVLRGVYTSDEVAGVPESDFPAHVRPALWILAMTGDLAQAGSTYTLTEQGLTRLAELDGGG